MKVYIVQGYSYEESYIMYITKDKEEALKTAKEFVNQKSSFKMGHIWFCVIEVELNKEYGWDRNETPQIWDEHDDLE